MNLITGQPAAVALAILALYWLNRNTLEFAREKREIIEIIRAERKEWLDTMREERRELIEINRDAIDAQHKVAHELHSLRNLVQPVVLSVQQSRGKGSDAEGSTGAGNSDDTR